MKQLKEGLPMAFLLLLLSITGCNINEIPNLDNTYLPDYEGGIAIIIGKDTLTVGDFIKELSEDTTIVKEGDNQELFFIYHDTTSFSLASDFVAIETFSNEKDIQSPIAFAFVPPADTTITIEQEVNFDFISENGERIDSVFYKSGNLNLTVTSTFPGDLDYSITTNSFLTTPNENNIVINSNLDYTGSTPVSNTRSVALSGYKTILQSQNDSSIFEIVVEANIHISGGTPLTGTEYLNIKMDVSNPEFESVYGGFGRDTFDIEQQEIAFDIFGEFSDSGLSFEGPSVSFEFKNSFGIPAGLSFSNIYAGFDDQDDLPMTGSFVENLQVIEAPTLQNAGSTVTSTLELNNTNSNISELLSSSPDRLIMNLFGVSNPNDETNNFLLEDSELTLISTIQLPLSVQMNEFEYESEFELGDISQLENGQEINILIKTINELPFNGEIDLIFVSEDDVDITSIEGIEILTSPEIFDENGKASEASENTATISLDAEKIDALVESSKLRIVTRFYSFGYEQNEFVQIFSDYSLITTVSVEGQVSINLNEQ